MVRAGRSRLEAHRDEEGSSSDSSRSRSRCDYVTGSQSRFLKIIIWICFEDFLKITSPRSGSAKSGGSPVGSPRSGGSASLARSASGSPKSEGGSPKSGGGSPKSRGSPSPARSGSGSPGPLRSRSGSPAR